MFVVTPNSDAKRQCKGKLGNPSQPKDHQSGNSSGGRKNVVSSDKNTRSRPSQRVGT